jgi:hypothetical protein
MLRRVQVVYALLFVGEDAAEQLLSSPTYLALEDNMKRGLVFVCEAGCSWLIDDGTRLMPKDLAEWSHCDQVFRELLTRRGIEYHVIPRDLVDIHARLQLVLGRLAESSMG